MFNKSTLKINKVQAGLAAASLIVSMLAFFVSVRSCNIAEKALNQSSKLFYEENKPYITVSPEESPTSKSFFLFHENKELILQYKIKNIGKVAASNINLNEINVPFDIFISDNIPYKGPPIITLGSGEEKYVEIKAISKKDLSYIKSDNFVGVKVQLTYTYFNELNSNLKYKTTVMHSIKNNNAELLKSDTEKIN